MKTFYAIALALLSVSAFAGKNTFSVGDGKVPDFDKYKRLKASMRFHVKEVRTDYDTIPGSIIHWYSDGTAETNLIRHIDLVVQTNTVERKIETLTAAVAREFVAYTNQLAQTAAYSNAYTIASRAASAASAKIQDEIADLEAKIVKYKEYQTKYPIVKSIFAALITDAENRIKVLKGLTNGE